MLNFALQVHGKTLRPGYWLHVTATRVDSGGDFDVLVTERTGVTQLNIGNKVIPVRETITYNEIAALA